MARHTSALRFSPQPALAASPTCRAVRRTIVCALLTTIAILFASGVLFATMFTALNDPLATNGTTAFGISGGNIVGQYGSSTGDFGFLYNGSTYTTLSDPLAGAGGSGTAAFGISGGNIVGTYSDSSPSRLSHGFLYNGSTYTTLDDPSGSNGTYAAGISGSNIVGSYTDFGNNSHAFLYNGSTYTTLDDPLGTGTYATGVSGGNIVGFYIDDMGEFHGFLFNGSTYTTLDDPLGTKGTQVEGIFGSDIVGYYSDSSFTAHGFLYNGSTYTTLDDPLGAKGTYLFGISGDNVVGYYRDASNIEHGFVATVPEPSSIALFGFAAIGFAVVARRRIRKQVSLKGQLFSEFHEPCWAENWHPLIQALRGEHDSDLGAPDLHSRRCP